MASRRRRDESSGSAGQRGHGRDGGRDPAGHATIIENVVEQIDAIVSPMRHTGWQTSQPGDREVRVQLRLVLKNNRLPPQGALFDRAYAYVREHY
ncbi:MAG: hypothetical protein ACYDEY_15075 [Acidimicrobiales bacterium]